MPHAFSDDTHVERPAIELLAGLAWQPVTAFLRDVTLCRERGKRPKPCNVLGTRIIGFTGKRFAHAGTIDRLLTHINPSSP